MKLSDFVVEFLVQKQVKHIFELCGGAITHILDSLHERKDINTISMHHEQTAAFAAEGYSRINGNVGVAMATSGPGATNLITGIGSCFFDSIPCLFITGQVNTYEFKFENAIRQLGFQETDIVSMVKPIVKEAVIIQNPNDIKYQLERLFYIAKSGRPGPVLLDIPLNIQRAEVDPKKMKSFYTAEISAEQTKIKKNKMREVIQLICNCQRPIVLVGGGVRLSQAHKELREFLIKTNFPVVSTLLGKDSFSNKNNNFMGMIGTYGNRNANLAIANADLVLVLGARLDTRQTGTCPDNFARAAKIIHVDIDKNELNNKVKTDYVFNADIKDFLLELNRELKNYNKKNIIKWHSVLKSFKTKYATEKNFSNKDMNPNFLCAALSGYMPKNSIVCVDVGQHQMWAAQSLKISENQRFLTQGGMGAMGSALAFAIGACFADKKATALVITGDGGFQLNTQELQTVYNYQLPIKIVMLNNLCYGMVRQFQEQYFDSKFQSTVIGYNAPNFQKVVSAYKIKTDYLIQQRDMVRKFQVLFKDNKPAFLEVKIRADLKVFPKLSVNKPVEDQEPFLSREELRSNMLIDLLEDS